MRRERTAPKVESVLHMESFLNLTWFFLAGTLVCLCLQGHTQAKTGRRQQLVAIAVLIAILFPVISMSDDLLAVQNASEADSYQRRDHLVPSSGSPVQPASAIVAVFIFAGFGFGFTWFAVPRPVAVHEPQYPELACVGNRPPPTA